MWIPFLEFPTLLEILQSLFLHPKHNQLTTTNSNPYQYTKLFKRLWKQWNVGIITIDKSFLGLFHPSTNFSNPALFFKFGKSTSSLPPLPFFNFLKGSMVYTILHNTNSLKYNWSQLISFNLTYTLCTSRNYYYFIIHSLDCFKVLS